MPKLYIEEYKKSLYGKTIFIACREGILRDYFSAVIGDIKFLNRIGSKTVLFHNISNRFANRKHFVELESRLPHTQIVRVPSDQDFYAFVLSYRKQMHKLIFLERKYLIDHDEHRINALNTSKARESFQAYGDVIANQNFKSIIEPICQKIEQGCIDRVHILPAGKQTIRHELFTIEGSGTLIANNFTESFDRVRTDDDVRMVADIIKIYQRKGFIKPRSRAYIQSNRDNFYSVKIDGILVGCAERISLSPTAVELGALAISTKFRNQRVGVFLINAFIEEMKQQGVKQLISLTSNPRLEALYDSMGFELAGPGEFSTRQAQSPTRKMYVKTL